MSISQKILQSIIVKPTGADCNLDCIYCFYIDKAKLYPDTIRHRMKDETLEIFIRQAMEQSGNEINIAWQGGEPCLMGLDFFRKVIALEEKYGKRKIIGNGLQTNGMLIDEKWAKFLAEYNFLVGLSLDGPQHIHDHYRKTVSGEGTWERVVISANLLLKAGVAVNAMTTITDYAAGFPEQIYDFHKNLGLTWMQFTPVVETDKTDESKASEFSVTPEKYLEFLIRIFELWKEDFKKERQFTSVRFFENLFYRYVGFTSPECTMQKECGCYLVMEHNGDVYACDFFVEPEWKLGNINEKTMTDMLNSEQQGKFGEIKSDLNASCKSCKWLTFCYGGCPKDRIRDPRDMGENHFCETYKQFFSYSQSHFEELALVWKKNNKVQI